MRGRGLGRKVVERKIILHLPDGRCVYVRQVIASSYWQLISYLAKKNRKNRKGVQAE